MDVFLLPVAADRYELYCEEHADHAVAADAPKGFVGKATHRFREQLAEAEREGRRPTPSDAPRRSWSARLKARMLRWVAESMAEQRLLWQLRGRPDARLVHPDDLTDAQAQQLLRRSLTRDWERHRFWLAIDSVIGVGSLLLVLLPGPNIIGYYFLFRIVGHYLSLRGARHGLSKTAWALHPSAPLTTLRNAVGQAPADRAAIVGGVATTLQLEHLRTFFDRCAAS